MPELPTLPLKDLVVEIIDRRGVTPRKLGSDFTSEGYRVISARTIRNRAVDLTADDERYISKDVYRRWMKTPLRDGDVLLTSEAPLGEPAYVQEAKPWVVGQRLFAIRTDPRKMLGRFLYYAVQSNSVRDDLLSRATGTTVLGIRQSELRNVKIPVPPLSHQEAIADILGTLDDKIELNRRMSETLEEILRESHRDWFSSSNAKLLQDSSEAALTSSWAPGSVGDLAYEKREGVNPSMMAPDTPYIGLEHMPRRRITLDMWGTAEGLGSNKYQFERGDILFGKLRPYFHKVGVAPVDGICSTDMVVVAAKEKAYASFLLGVLSSDEFVQFTDSSSTGTRMPRTSWKTMASYPIRIPPLALAHAYNDFAEPIIARTINATFENKTLAELRDTLLPKLISGEIRVPQAERLVSEVV